MGQPVADSKTPAYVAFALIAAGIAIALVQDWRAGSILGALVAASATIPACYGMWKGIQQETQGTLALSVIAVLLSLAVAAVLIILRVVDWVR
jgi:hypothetical protein